jgi:sugar lactone lactonase YvrE/fibronectin type 3 domain-containing protein
MNNSISVVRFSVLTLASIIVFSASAQAASPTLVAAFFVKGKVGLKWQKIGAGIEYIVYRKADADFERIATTDEDHYFDVDVAPGATYTYKIAIVENGVEANSAERSVTIPEDAGGFVPPKWVGMRVDGERIMLRWDPIPGAVAYNVFRSTTPGEDYEVVGNAPGARYVDRTNLEKGTTYYYVLSALNAEFEETGLSEEKSVKFGVSLAEQQEMLAEENRIVLEPVALKQLFTISQAVPVGTMNQPADIAVNSQGMIYVTDTLNGMVHCFESNGRYSHSFGQKIASDDEYEDGGFVFPFTLFIDAKDQVYVADVKRNDIQVFSADGRFLRRIRVNTGVGNAALRPNGIHVLDDGRIVLTDTGNHRFLITDRNGTIQLSVGTRGDEKGQFNFPDELTVTPSGTICVVDVINCRVQTFDMKGEFLSSFGEVGQSAGTFARPKGIAVDERGRIWVSDSMANMIQSFTPEGEVKAAVGTLEDEWAFSAPRGLFFKDGRFYVVNRLQNEVIVFAIG